MAAEQFTTIYRLWLTFYFCWTVLLQRKRLRAREDLDDQWRVTEQQRGRVRVPIRFPDWYSRPMLLLSHTFTAERKSQHQCTECFQCGTAEKHWGRNIE